MNRCERQAVESEIFGQPGAWQPVFFAPKMIAHLVKKAWFERFAGAEFYESETLAELMQADRVAAIKQEFVQRSEKRSVHSAKLMDILIDGEDLGCVSCFV